MFTELMPNLYCQDLQASVKFYRDLLGLQQTYQFPPDGTPEHIELKIGGAYLAISSLEALENSHLPPASHNAQPFELAIRAQNTDEAVARLRVAGVPVLIEPHVSVNGQRIAYVLDPDGNRIHLYSAL